MKDINNPHNRHSQSEAGVAKKIILIFKTNITSSEDFENTGQLLDALPGILRWNINLDDEDKVLRIESTKNITSLVIETLTDNGYTCEELPD